MTSNSSTTVTPETLSRHELAGLAVRVVAASNPDLVDIEGRVVDETTRTLYIEPSDGGAARVKQVPKDAATFEFRLPAGTEDASTVTVTVEGERLVERPARRTERGSDSKWR